jgi:stalled ribosome alternative rescue factor ArfA
MTGISGVRREMLRTQALTKENSSGKGQYSKRNKMAQTENFAKLCNKMAEIIDNPKKLLKPR